MNLQAMVSHVFNGNTAWRGENKFYLLTPSNGARVGTPYIVQQDRLGGRPAVFFPTEKDWTEGLWDTSYTPPAPPEMVSITKAEYDELLALKNESDSL